MTRIAAHVPCSLGAALLLALGGCSPPPATDYATQPEAALVGKKEQSTDAASETAAKPTAVEPAAAKSTDEIIREVWDETYFQEVKVGFGKTEVAKVREGERTLVRCRQTGEIHLQRAEQSSDQVMSFTCWQTEDGNLIRFESEMDGGGTKTLGDGKVEGNRLRVQTHTSGKTDRQSFDWQPEWGGYGAMEESLRRQPLKPGEERTLVALTAPTNSPAVTKLAAEDYEVAKLRPGEQRLLKVKAATHLGELTIDSTLWVDEKGEILKTRQSLGLETYRTTKAAATNLATLGKVDLLQSSIVKPKDSTNPARERAPAEFAAELGNARRAVYLARLKEGDPEKVFSSGLSQQVEKVDGHAARLTLTSVRPDNPPSPGAKIAPPSPDALLASSYIQSDDPEVVRLANSVAESETDAWKIACALEKFVDETITDKNFGSALATAAEVARSKAGDCTEHSVLFAALCRARKIPARVAFGLIYTEHLGGFAYHMWTEVWTGDRWVPMDATLGRGGIGCDHLKLGDSNLQGSDSLAAMASVAQVLNQLELEVVAID